jgi:hypothetical protein
MAKKQQHQNLLDVLDFNNLPSQKVQPAKISQVQWQKNKQKTCLMCLTLAISCAIGE